MTSFARLADPEGMSKAAGIGSMAIPAVKHLWNKGVWSGVGSLASRFTGRAGVAGAAARGTSSVANVMANPRTQMAGLALIPASMAGVPGADALSNVMMPGWAAAQAAAPAITSARLATGKYNNAIKADATKGSQVAVNDFLNVAQRAPESFSRPGQYKDLLQQYGLNIDNIAGKGAAPLTKWQQRLLPLTDPQTLVNQKVRDGINRISKQAGIGSVAGAALRGVSKALPLAMGGTMAYGAGKAMFEEKPYDSVAVQQEGYDATQGKINKSVDAMNPFERLAVRADPTLAFGKAEQALPGTIKRWEQESGQKYTPGWLESTRQAWTTGGTPNFYTYDISGNRNYLPQT